MKLDPFKHPVCLEFPLWLEQTAWGGHIPFAMFLISAMRPRLLVELGTFRGESYCAFCQAVKNVGSETKCCAVDTWAGDEHCGPIGPEVLAKLKAHHDPLYAGFSRLIQATFDDALAEFPDGSIDLLHIDGFHTYEAVSHDYETWKPKMSERGIVLFHDTTVRDLGFGVWKFWDEIKSGRPHFEFLHSHGLGVLVTGSEIPEDLRPLFEADEAETGLIRNFFAALGGRIEMTVHYQLQSKYVEELQKYESLLKGSRMIRAYRTWKEEGLGSVLKKLVK